MKSLILISAFALFDPTTPTPMKVCYDGCGCRVGCAMVPVEKPAQCPAECPRPAPPPPPDPLATICRRGVLYFERTLTPVYYDNAGVGRMARPMLERCS